MEVITLTIPFPASPVAIILITFIFALSAVRAIARFIDTLPFT